MNYAVLQFCRSRFCSSEIEVTENARSAYIIVEIGMMK